MSKAASSPTARLLQQSRLFSLPRNLPPPALEAITSAGVLRASETATLPYPVYQSIATPASSHHRGDWGEKRQLPGRATKSSTPHLRILAHDNLEHITDFESAADHTQSLAKWQEMQIPLIHRSTRNTITGNNKSAPVSVFEDHLDSTDPEDAEKVRWKYKGPWIAGMQEGEFDGYLSGPVALQKSKGAWREFLRQRLIAKKRADAQRLARDEGLNPEEKAAEVDVSNEELAAQEKRLRDDHADSKLTSELTALITDFLDLPAVHVKDSLSTEIDFATPAMKAYFDKATSDKEDSPLSTHPSAGLSHIRSNAFMENHPLYGPQAYRSPILSRVVKPRNSATGTENQAKIGVGGVVTNDPVAGSYGQERGRRMDRGPEADRMAHALDPEIKGGNKFWVHPDTAYVDEKGRIRLDILRGDKEAIGIKTGNIEHISNSTNAALDRARAMGGRMAQLDGVQSSPPRGTQGNANYGFSLPDMRRAAADVPRAPQTRGFDEELGRKQGQGEMDKESASARIREIMESGSRRQ